VNDERCQTAEITSKHIYLQKAPYDMLVKFSSFVQIILLHLAYLAVSVQWLHDFANLFDRVWVWRVKSEMWCFTAWPSNIESLFFSVNVQCPIFRWKAGERELGLVRMDQITSSHRMILFSALKPNKFYLHFIVITFLLYALFLA